MAVTIQGVNGITFNDASTQSKSAATGQAGSAPFYTARAWVNWNGGTTISGSGNVSSVTQDATGVWTLNLTTALPDANYAVCGIATNSGSAFAQVIQLEGYNYTLIKSTTQVRVSTRNNSAGLNNSPNNSVVLFG